MAGMLKRGWNTVLSMCTFALLAGEERGEEMEGERMIDGGDGKRKNDDSGGGEEGGDSKELLEALCSLAGLVSRPISHQPNQQPAALYASTP
ncbi:hypothetical protein TWF718_005958 [Orbilia javanica]|uniref:Secreted protein n=1 Tax=Orbilia javanica TaxID=47235 RepID=A0AAN8RJG9_9PEZI